MVKAITPLGTVAWSAMVQPRENLQRELEWSAGLVVDEQQSVPLLELFNRLVAERRAKDPSFPDPAGPQGSLIKYPVKPSGQKDQAGNFIPEPGKVVFSFKRKVQVRARTGVRNNTAPVIYDSQGMVVTGNIVNVPSKSTGRIIYDAYAYNTAGNFGISLELVGFQIFSLAEDEIELTALEGGWTAGDSAPVAAPAAPPVAPPPGTPQPAPQPQPVPAGQPYQMQQPAPQTFDGHPVQPQHQAAPVQAGPMPTWHAAPAPAAAAPAPAAAPAQPSVLDMLRQGGQG